MKKSRQKVARKISRIMVIALILSLCVHTLAMAIDGTVEYALDSRGTMSFVTSNGSVEVQSSVVRAGSSAFKHSVNATTATKRAEIDDSNFHAYDAKNHNYWYGFSYYIPDNSQWNTDIKTIMAQWRFSNVDQNCAMSGQGGSGSHLNYDKGNWVFWLLHQDPSKASCAGLLAKSFDLGAVSKGVWTDFVIQAKWRHTTDGFIKIWKQENNGGYVLVKQYNGITWFDKYKTGSPLGGMDVAAPNFTCGLYWNNLNVEQTAYTDELSIYTLPTSQDDGSTGFNKVKPDRRAGVSPYVIYETESMTKTLSSGDSQQEFGNPACSNGKGTVFLANQVNDYITFDVNVSQTGTYKVYVNSKYYSDRGKYQLSIDGTNLGPVVDQRYTYNDESIMVEQWIGNITFNSTGVKKFKFNVTGTSGTEYKLGLDYIKLQK